MDTNEDETLLIRVHSCDSWDKSIYPTAHVRSYSLIFRYNVRSPIPRIFAACSLFPFTIFSVLRMSSSSVWLLLMRTRCAFLTVTSHFAVQSCGWRLWRPLFVPVQRMPLCFIAFCNCRPLLVQL